MSMKTIFGTIFDIKKYAIHDGPGIRTTVFLQGCPLRCLWCHNPESQPRHPVLFYRANRCAGCAICLEICPQHGISRSPSPSERAVDGEESQGNHASSGMPGGAFSTDRALCTVCGSCAEVCYYGAREISGREVSVAEVLAEIERDRPFYDQSGGGVTFSGGEPLLQPRFLGALLRACRELEIHTVVDTSGYVDWAVLDQLRANVDLFLYDLKLIDDARHRQATGVSNIQILDNLVRLTHHGHPVYIRIPLIPGINADDDNLRQSGAFLQKLPQLNGVELVGYHDLAAAKYAALDRPEPVPGLQPPSRAQLSQAANILTGFGLDVKISC